ncbi:MAG: ribonuclease R, partial [Nitrospinaceae bacterium]
MDLSDESLLRQIQRHTDRPLKFSEMMKVLKVPEAQRREFRGRLKELVVQGAMIKLRGGRYGLPDEMSLVTGTLQGHPDGYGFLIPEGGEPDLFIGRKETNGAMHGDRVVARLERKRTGWGRPEGRIIRILERRTASLVGVYESMGREGWVIPAEEKVFHDVFIPGKHRGGAKPGQVVVVDIVEPPTRHQPPIGRVREVLGRSDDPQVELRSIFHKFGVSRDFPPEVLDAARRISPVISAAEKKARRDLTGWTIFTIDGDRAKDFDDAVSLECVDSGFVLGVHIADVSHYVPEGGVLDREAFDRGTSIYFADGVIPMLPTVLSNEICSLKPDVERLTVTVLMRFTKDGDLEGHEVFPSFIRSRRRWTYTQVWDLLRDGGSSGGSGDLAPHLARMYRLSGMLRRRRFASGSIDFQIPEPEILMHPDGSVQTIQVAAHNPAHELIEEFMLAANQVVARHLTRLEVPLVHRVHEPPDPEKIREFSEFIQGLGHKLPAARQVSSRHLNRLLMKVRDRPEGRAINTLLLRALKKAVYAEEPLGHFGLGFEDYTHFTSPIRRYPDLAVHRLVKQFQKKKKAGVAERKRLRKKAEQVAGPATDREVRAQQVEREVHDLRRAQFMEDRVGEVFSGIISGVQAFGFFVELQEVFVEGL